MGLVRKDGLLLGNLVAALSKRVRRLSPSCGVTQSLPEPELLLPLTSIMPAAGFFCATSVILEQITGQMELPGRGESARLSK